MTKMDTDAAPFLELYPDRLGTPLTCIGAGGMGSGILPMFVRFGVTCVDIWDDDKVEAVNLQIQNFNASDIGKFKSLVVASRMVGINPKLDATAHTRRFTQHDLLDGIVVSAVDSMESRQTVFDAVLQQKERVPLLIDGRFSRKGDFVDLYCIDTRSEKELENYKAWLHPQCDVLWTPRADSMTAHVPHVLSGLIGEALAGWVQGRGHPWKVTYDAVSHHTERFYADGSN